MSENNDLLKRGFLDLHSERAYHGSVQRFPSSSLIRINDGDESTCVFTETGFVEMLRAAREVLSKDKARAVALYYAKFLEDEDQSARDWPEDAARENGQYHNTCAYCGKVFTGLKGRTICRVCMDKE